MTIFKPEDFEPFYMDKKQLSDHASRILTEWIEKNGVKVYGVPYQANCSTGFHEIKSQYDTHQAILIDIQEIEKKPCDHIFNLNYGIDLVPQKAECKKCGFKLKANWIEVES